MLLAKLLKKSLIVHVHAFSAESIYEHTALSAGRYCLGLADRVVALSDSWANALRARDPFLSLCVIPNPVISHARHARECSAPVVLYAGKLESRKGYQDLMTAAASVLKQVPGVEFWFAGHGELQQAADLANRLGIQSSVRLMGWLSEKAMTEAYDKATIFCLPSYNEGVPMVVLEAMARGLPVVCTAVGGLPDFVQDDENGLFAVPGDPQSIAASILQLLSDRAYAQQMGLNASRTIRARCSLATISDQLEHLYRTVEKTSSHRSASAEKNEVKATMHLSGDADSTGIHEPAGAAANRR
jgi:glycosyltransferase involved in cell wall biosynthesis